MRKNKPELLAPAGSWSSLLTAVENGADSVYFGIKGLNMRQGAENFDLLELKKVMDLLHKRNKKGYLALNVIVMNQELRKVKKILEEAKQTGVDAVILWDMAVFSLAKEMGLKIHLSTQASVSNIKALEFFVRQGAERIVLARECTLADIKRMIRFIKKEGLPCEIETFIHGAMCISISGRCFLSAFSFGKSANRGQCWQPCRREFFIKDDSGDVEYVLGKDYVLSPKDLCSIDFIDELIEAEINAFKIEGRMRPPEYLKVVTSVYREAIDECCAGRLDDSFKGGLKERLATVYNRGFSSGFAFGQPQDAKSKGTEHQYEKIYLGEVSRFYKKISVADIRIQNESLRIGEQILFIGKNTPALMTTVEELQSQHVPVQSGKKGEAVGVKLPFRVNPKDKVFLWKKRECI